MEHCGEPVTLGERTVTRAIFFTNSFVLKDYSFFFAFQERCLMFNIVVVSVALWIFLFLLLLQLLVCLSSNGGFYTHSLTYTCIPLRFLNIIFAKIFYTARSSTDFSWIGKRKISRSIANTHDDVFIRHSYIVLVLLNSFI